MLRVSAALLIAGAGLAGCQNQYGTTPIHDDRGAYNIWTIEAVNDGSVRNAILAQHTLYPYHFVDFSDQLNELGRRDVNVLASHYGRYPGVINVRRGSERQNLYEARLRTVADALAASGVDPATVEITDGMPRGGGQPAERVIAIHAADTARLQSGGAASTGGATTGTTGRPSSTTTTGTGVTTTPGNR